MSSSRSGLQAWQCCGNRGTARRLPMPRAAAPAARWALAEAEAEAEATADGW